MEIHCWFVVDVHCWPQIKDKLDRLLFHSLRNILKAWVVVSEKQVMRHDLILHVELAALSRVADEQDYSDVSSHGRLPIKATYGVCRSLVLTPAENVRRQGAGGSFAPALKLQVVAREGMRLLLVTLAFPASFAALAPLRLTPAALVPCWLTTSFSSGVT